MLAEQGQYVNSTNGVTNYTITMSHLITNKIDAYYFQAQLIILILLFQYICLKLHHYAKQYDPLESNINIKSQIIFLIFTLFIIIQLFYTVIGFELDQDQWRIKGTDIYLKYCDYSFAFEQQKKCFIRYEINGFLSNLNTFLTCLAIQMVTFWKRQISPFQFLNVNQVIFDQSVTRSTKKFYLFFTTIDLTMIVIQIISVFLKYSQESIKILQISSMIFVFFTAGFLLLSIWQQYTNRERFYNSKILTTALFFIFLISREGQLILRFFRFDEEYVSQNYERSLLLYQFTLYQINFIDNFYQFIITHKYHHDQAILIK